MKLIFEHLFAEKILDRGYECSIEGKVECIHQEDSIYSATVQGTQPYHVVVEFKGNRIVNMQCDCQYAKNDRCKHMAALLISLQNDGDSQEIEVHEVDADMDKEWAKVLQTIPAEELIAFLTSKMENEVSFQNELKSQFPTYFDIDMQTYICEWESIVEDAQDGDGFIDYNHASDFECNASVFLSEIQVLSSVHPLISFRICAFIYYDLAKIEMDGSGGQTSSLAAAIQEIILMILQCGKSAVIQEVRTWLYDSMDDLFLSDYCLNEGLDVLYIESFPISERIEMLKELIECKHTSEYDLHQGEYIKYILQTFQDCGKCDEQIYEELLRYKQFTPARNWIIEFLLKKMRLIKQLLISKKDVLLMAGMKTSIKNGLLMYTNKMAMRKTMKLK